MASLLELVSFINSVNKAGVSKENKELFVSDAHEISLELRKESPKLAIEFDIWAKSKLAE